MKRVAVAAVLSLTVLTACGAQAPPASELADEMIATLEGVSDEAKECMRQAVDDFRIAPESGFIDLDDVATKASEGQPQALELMERFEADLAACI